MIRMTGMFILTFGIITSCGTKTSEETTEQTEEQPTEEAASSELFFKISLAEWSLHKAIQGKEMTNLEFPAKAKELGINAVEYVSTLFDKDASDMEYLAELKKVTDDLGVTNVLIMIDNEGDLGDLDEAKRIKAVENHYRWVDAAKFLGCHSIRVNARGHGDADEVAKAAIDGLSRLAEYGASKQINIIVENHGGNSSDGKWLSNVIKSVGNDYCGTLPDFGNFRISEDNNYDRYLGIDELMPYAKGVSAKSNNFDEEGNEVVMDYGRILEIVKKHGYTGYIGIEYEGDAISEVDGIIATKKLLEKEGAKIK